MNVLDVYGYILLAGFGFTATRAGLPQLRGSQDDRIGTGIAAAGCAIGVGLLAVARALL